MWAEWPTLFCGGLHREAGIQPEAGTLLSFGCPEEAESQEDGLGQHVILYVTEALVPTPWERVEPHLEV